MQRLVKCGQDCCSRIHGCGLLTRYGDIPILYLYRYVQNIHKPTINKELIMGLFGKKNAKRCPECKYYVMVEGYGYCAKAIPATVNIRLLSSNALRRECQLP